MEITKYQAMKNLTPTPIIDARRLSETVEFRNFSNAVAELQVIDLNTLISDEEKTVFFVNCYNMLSIHSHIHREICAAHKKRRFKSTRSLSYVIGSVPFSLKDIKYSVLRCEQPSRSKMTFKRMTSDTVLSGFSLEHPNALIHYILHSKTGIGPPIQPLQVASVYRSMYRAAREFLLRTVQVDVKRQNVVLPAFFLTNESDFPGPERNLLEGILRVLSEARNVLHNTEIDETQLCNDLNEVLAGDLPPKLMYRSSEVKSSRKLRLHIMN